MILCRGWQEFTASGGSVQLRVFIWGQAETESVFHPEDDDDDDDEDKESLADPPVLDKTLLD